MANEFDVELNRDYHKSVFDTQSNLISDVTGGVVASVADMGASLWNSTIGMLPGVNEVDTSQLLARISNNALRVYEENPDTIHTASFIGGLLIPSTLAIKGVNALRSGSKAVNWFTKAGREASEAELKTLYAAGQGETTAYRAAVRNLYAKGLGNQALDAAAAELAVLSTFSAHPFMEDYLKDPVENFGMSLALGTVIGGGLGHVADRFIVKGFQSELSKEAFDATVGKMRDIPANMTNTTALQSHQVNIGTLENILAKGKESGLDTTNDLTMQYAEKALTQAKGQQLQLWEEMLQGDLAKLPAADKDALLQQILGKTQFHQVEELRPLTEAQITGKGISPTRTKAVDDVEEPSFVKKVLKKDGTSLEKEISVAWFPDLQTLAPVNEAPNLAGAAALGKTLEQIEKEASLSLGKLPNHDAPLELVTKSTAIAQRDLIAHVARFNKLKDNELAALTISEDDMDALTALIARLDASPTGYKTKVKVASDVAQSTEQIAEKQMQTASKGLLGPDGRPISYVNAVAKFTSPEIMKDTGLWYSSGRSVFGLSGDSSDMLQNWISGDGVARMRRAASDYFGSRNKGFGRIGVNETEVKFFQEIYEHPKSVAFREEFQKLADADGMVLLYRGSRAEQQRGHAILESYTTDPTKAAEFGTPRLYRVHVEDIVTGFLDIPNSSGIRKNEFIVRAGARPVEAKLDKTGRAQFINQATGQAPAKAVLIQPNSREVYRAELQDMLISAKERVIQSMWNAGTPPLTIMRKTNTPLDTVLALGIGSHSLDEMVNIHGFKLNAIGNMTEAAEALSIKHLPIGLSGDIKKANYTARHSQLDAKSLDDMNKGILEATFAKSESPLAKAIGTYLFQDMRTSLDILRQQLGWVNNSAAGSRFFNSSDFWARNMKDAGLLANHLGKEFEHMRNNAIKAVVEPISQQFSKVTQDATAVYESNLFFNLNSGLSGFRVYKNRTLYNLVETLDDQGKVVMQEQPVLLNGKPFMITNDSVDTMIQELQAKSKELLSLANTKRAALGQAPVNDIGLWIPSFNPINKFVAYLHNTATQQTQVILARTDKELAELTLGAKKWAQEHGKPGQYQVFDKSDQQAYSLMNGRADPVFMQKADNSMFKSGAAKDLIPKNTLEVFSDIASGYEHYITAQSRQLIDIALSDITTTLGRMSAKNKALTANQPLDAIKRALFQQEDAAGVLRNTLLGNPNLKEYQGWEAANGGFEIGLAMGLNVVQKAWATFAEPSIRYVTKNVKDAATGLMKKEKVIDATALKNIDYESFAKLLEEKGIPNVYQEFDNAAAKVFNLARIEDHKDVSKRLIYGSNALAATAVLRFGEIAQPLVNALSLPILTSLAAASKMPATFLGAQLKTGEISVAQAMHEGLRAMHSPRFKALSKEWEEKGYFTPMVSEVTSLLQSSRQFEKGALAAVENGLESNFVKIMSKPADFSESMVRKATMFTGYMLAKRLYPELGDQGATIFARDFMDKAVGNFHASQRPVFFQGTLGVALGLFQTYILTLGQSVYRQLELKNYKALGKATLAQASIFGGQSLPGFHPISEMIGEHYSDEHVDLTTGTYRAINDQAANLVLYGLPSNLGPALFTRGDISPRPPNLLAGAQNTVAVSVLSQGMQMLGEVKRAMEQDSASMARAFGQALSLQSVSRPIARIAELGTGYSIDSSGNTVSTPEEVWTTTGWMSRILSTRPFDEAVYRQANHLSSYYGAIDRDARKEVTKKLRTAIRSGELSDEQIESYAEEYMRKGGTPTGWKAAYREAVARTEENGKDHLLNKLKEDSPLNFMMNSLD